MLGGPSGCPENYSENDSLSVRPEQDQHVYKPAALRANIQITNILPPRVRVGIGPTPTDFVRKITVRTLPRTPRGEGGQEQNETNP